MYECDATYQAHWYDLLWASDPLEPPELTFLRPWAHAARRVVEVGAGTGRIALPLASEGVHVVAVEPDSRMRTALLTKLAQTPHLFPQLTVLPHTGTTFSLPEPVALAYACGVIFHLLTDAEQIALLRNLYQHVQAGGRVVLDSIGLHEGVSPLPPTLVHEITIGAVRYRATMSRDVLAPSLHRWHFVYESAYEQTTLERVEVATLARVVSRTEMRTWLHHAGFIVEAEYDAYPGAQVQASHGVIVVARKPADAASGAA